MFGLGAARRKSGKNSFRVNPREIPGFSKWIAHEIYTESKLVELTLDKLALVMEESERELSERMDMIMDAVLSGGTEEEVGSQDSDVEIVDEDKDEIRIQNESPDATVNINDTGISTLLLKSPSKDKRVSSPLRRIQERKLELVTATTSLLINNNTNSESIKQSTTSIDTIPDKLANDSFEAISRQIRKSFVIKTKSNSKNSESPTNFSNTATGETESTDPNIAEPLIPNERLLIVSKGTSSPEKEVEEISRLIENRDNVVDDKSDLSAFEEDLSIDIGPLEKIDIQTRKSELLSILPNNNDITKSPIKFHEIPTREPIVLDSNRKSIRKSVVSVATRMNSQSNVKQLSTNVTTNMFETPKPVTAKKKIPSDIEEDSVFIDKSNTKIDRNNYQLHLPPGRFVSSGQDTSQDEPTIKINRKIRKPTVNINTLENKTPVQTREKLTFTKSLPHMNIPLVESSPQVRQSPINSKDFIDRLMKPTQSSMKRQRESPLKLMHGSTPSKKVHTGHLNENEDSPTTVLVPLKGDDSPNIRPKATGTAFMRSQSLGSGLSPKKPKRSVPLTMKPLKSNEGLRKSSGTSTIQVSPPRKMLIHSMNKVGIGLVGAFPKKQRSEKVVTLKKPTVSVIAAEPSITIGTKTVITKPEQLPDIDSGAEDEEAVCLADWGGRELLRGQLRAQSKTNPVEVFGGLETVDCDAIFGQRYSLGMNIRWREGDLLSARELASYERVMGWRV